MDSETPQVNRLQEFLNRQAELRQELEDLQTSWLHVNGWRRTSSLPGSYVLWQKSFPESKVQWSIDASGNRVPEPPFEATAATLGTAIKIETAWQENWI